MGGLSLTGALGPVAWHLGGTRRETEDVDIPGFALSDAARAEEEEHAEEEGEELDLASGMLPNSGLENEAGSAGISLIGDAGFVGVSYSGLDSLYGIPGGHADHEEEEGEEGAGGEEGEVHAEEEGVKIDLRQRRIDLRGESLRASHAHR